MPVNDVLNWKANFIADKISIHNNTGKLVHFEDKPLQNLIDISDLNPGFYFLKFNFNNGKIVIKKLIIQ